MMFSFGFGPCSIRDHSAIFTCLSDTLDAQVVASNTTEIRAAFWVAISWVIVEKQRGKYLAIVANKKKWHLHELQMLIRVRSSGRVGRETKQIPCLAFNWCSISLLEIWNKSWISWKTIYSAIKTSISRVLKYQSQLDVYLYHLHY